jgi:hypothetical protein
MQFLGFSKCDVDFRIFYFVILICGTCFIFSLSSAYGQVFLQNVNMTDNLSNWGTGQITLSNITIEEDGITLQKNETAEPRKFSFFRLGSSAPFTINLKDFDSILNFTISTPGLADTMLTVSGTQISSLQLDGISSPANLSWDGIENTIDSGDAQSICLFCSNSITSMTISDQNSCQIIGLWNSGKCTIGGITIDSGITLAIAPGIEVVFTGATDNLGVINNMGKISNSGTITNSGTINNQCGAIYNGSLPSGNPIVDSCVSCTPSLGDWTINTSCQLSTSASVTGNVVIQNNSALIIPTGKSLNIDFAHKHLLIKSGSKVLIKSGGKIN